MEQLRKYLRNSTRQDVRLVWTLLHKDIYLELAEGINTTDPSVVCEACFIICDQLYPPVSRIDWDGLVLPDYLYHVPHDPDDWAAVTCNEIWYGQMASQWVEVPIVPLNRYKPIKPYEAHINVTRYVVLASR